MSKLESVLQSDEAKSFLGEAFHTDLTAGDSTQVLYE